MLAFAVSGAGLVVAALAALMIPRRAGALRRAARGASRADGGGRGHRRRHRPAARGPVVTRRTAPTSRRRRRHRRARRRDRCAATPRSTSGRILDARRATSSPSRATTRPWRPSPPGRTSAWARCTDGSRPRRTCSAPWWRRRDSATARSPRRSWPTSRRARPSSNSSAGAWPCPASGGTPISAPPWASARGAGLEQIAPLLADIVERSKEAGTLRPDVEVTDVVVVLKAVRSIADLCDTPGQKPSLRFLELALDGLRPGHVAPAHPPLTVGAAGQDPQPGLRASRARPGGQGSGERLHLGQRSPELGGQRVGRGLLVEGPGPVGQEVPDPGDAPHVDRDRRRRGDRRPRRARLGRDAPRPGTRGPSGATSPGTRTPPRRRVRLRARRRRCDASAQTRRVEREGDVRLRRRPRRQLVIEGRHPDVGPQRGRAAAPAAAADPSPVRAPRSSLPPSTPARPES